MLSTGDIKGQSVMVMYTISALSTFLQREVLILSTTQT